MEMISTELGCNRHSYPLKSGLFCDSSILLKIYIILTEIYFISPISSKFVFQTLATLIVKTEEFKNQQSNCSENQQIPLC